MTYDKFLHIRATPNGWMVARADPEIGFWDIENTGGGWRVDGDLFITLEEALAAVFERAAET